LAGVDPAPSSNGRFLDRCGWSVDFLVATAALSLATAGIEAMPENPNLLVMNPHNPEMALSLHDKVRCLDPGHPGKIRYGIITATNGDTCTVTPVYAVKKMVNVPVKTQDGHMPLMEGAIVVSPKWGFKLNVPYIGINASDGSWSKSKFPWTPCNCETETIPAPYKRTASK
jgi:hypothetical protein